MKTQKRLILCVCKLFLFSLPNEGSMNLTSEAFDREQKSFKVFFKALFKLLLSKTKQNFQSSMWKLLWEIN